MPEIVYTSTGELASRWRALTPTEQARGGELLADAEDILRGLFTLNGRDLDAEVDSGAVPVRRVNRVVVAMVARAMAVENQGAAQEAMGFGPFTRSITPADANLFLRTDELRQLGLSLVAEPRAEMGDTDPSLTSSLHTALRDRVR